MLGRSLLSFLAVAAVVVQSATAALLDGGRIYMITSHANFFLTADGKNAGSYAVLQYRDQAPPGFQEWEAERDFDANTVVLRNVGTGLYLAPSPPDNLKSGHGLVVQSEEPYVWRELQSERGGTYFLQDTRSPYVIGHLPLEVFPTRLELQEFNPGNNNQKFTFSPVDNIVRETRTHKTCGPWRMTRESFYFH